MGSVGLEQQTGRSWEAHDLDSHVPSDSRGWKAPDEERIYRATESIAMMEQLDYTLVERHDHEFQKEGCSVEFGGLHSLPAFAGVPLEALEEVKDGDVRFICLL